MLAFQEEAQNGRSRDPPATDEAPTVTELADVEGFAALQGALVYASYDGKRKPYLAAELDWASSPHTTFSRQKRFALDSGGNLLNPGHASAALVPGQVDAASLVPGADGAGAATLPQKRRRGESEDEGAGVRGGAGSEEPPAKRRSVEGANGGPAPSPVSAANLRVQKFDAKRNREKKRKSWYGPVKETYEQYFLASRKVQPKLPHQPLISVTAPDCLRLCDMWRVAAGTPVSTIVQEGVDAQFETQPELCLKMMPEMMLRHAVGPGALFLASTLISMERHLTTCALRDMFADRVDVVMGIPLLTRALTSTGVSSSENYERLELLGDAVLKLASTVRLFVRFPHHAEGDMHPLRCSIVSNSVLNAKAKQAGIEHYLNFTRTFLQDWQPPGYEANAQPMPVHDKALADVVEAMAGAYYLQGAADCRRRAAAGAEDGDGNAAMDAEDDARAASSETQAVVQGYRTGTRFLEAVGVLEDSEPTHEELLLSAIYAMRDPKAPRPTTTKPSSFPADRRMTEPDRPWAEHLGRLEAEIGYKFKRRQLLLCALTHGSYAESLGTDGRPLLSKYETFQRLEFLGDAALDFVVARYLFDRYPNQGPGDLTELKSAVVSNEAFARISIKRHLHQFLCTRSKPMQREVAAFEQICGREEEARGRGEEVELWMSPNEAPKVLGDIFEAIVGAILVDAGLEAVWNICRRLLGETLAERADPATYATHPVKQFQDFITKEHRISTVAPEFHFPGNGAGKLIRAEVYVGKHKVASGDGSTKRRAQCVAARRAHERLTAALSQGSEDAAFLEVLRLGGDRQRADLQNRRRRA
jgi:dsRNA-specific ribonuclease